MKKILMILGVLALLVGNGWAGIYMIDSGVFSLGTGGIRVYSASGSDYDYLWSFETSLDADKGGMVGTIERDSAASYIDTSGVLQIADGDSTSFSHDSIEDETGYTGMQGSFVDDQAWFDGEVLGSEEVVDGTFDTADDDVPWVTSGDWIVGSGVASITGVATNLSQAGVGTAGVTYQISIDINSISGGTGVEVIGGTSATSGGRHTFSSAGASQTAEVTWDGITPNLYIKNLGGATCEITNVSVKQITASLADQADTANLLIIDDGSAKGYGYCGEAGTGETLTALTNNITAITKANPGVVSSVAHGLSVGSLIYFDSLTEMTELNETYQVVTAKTTDTFSINDTSGYTTAESTGGACGHEVTEPAATAVHIYKDYELTDEGWNALDTDLDYNKGDDWDFDVYQNLMSSTGSTAQPRFEEKGLLNEGEGTNWCLHSNDFDEWSISTDVAATQNITGPDGVSNSAWLISGVDADSDRVLQNFPPGRVPEGSEITISIWVKGSGTIRFNLYENGDTYTSYANDSNIVLTSEWQRVVLSGTKDADNNPAVLRILDMLGDTVHLFGAQFEATPYTTSYIPTTDIPAIRTADSYTWAMSDDFKDLMGSVADSPFTMVCEFTPKIDYGDTSGNNSIINVAASDTPLLRITQYGRLSSDDGPNYSDVDPDYTANTTYTYALRVYDDSGTTKFEVGEKHDEVWTWDATPANYDGSFNPSTNLIIGYLNEYPFNIKNLKFYDSAKTQAWIEAKYPIEVAGLDYDSAWGDDYTAAWGDKYTTEWQ